MVNEHEKGQSTLEFVLILAVLTVIGAYLGWKMMPTQGGGGAIMSVQMNAVQKIGKD